VVWQCLCPWFHLSPSILSLTQRTWSQARDIVGPFSEKTGGRSVGEQD
jgi:hypothetical protein